jgi:nitric oxide reductase NorE protein
MTHSQARADAELPEFLGGGDDAGHVALPLRPAKFRPGHIPGEAGLWIFILGDMPLFAAILLVFLWDRRSQPGVFKDAAHQLIQPIGAVNTLVLLLSSYLVVGALCAHRAARYAHARRLVAALRRPHTRVGEVLQLLLHLTGLHLLHVIVGAALLAAWQLMLKRRRAWAGAHRVAEGIASYWHMVDLLWVVIFAVVYLVSAE